ncbi:ROK family transcriptional regulator [Paramicrobacterium fandaimingii]|uniref:ROK family transcriptional regulator n=1 Tax=Paramicrobacterium fandaimingii TaxID=2708079 RepID=UPI001F363DC4|nr:ROK family transcriptional regulator [Microbacterium fandaimingii]
MIDAITQHGGLTQVELAGATGLSPATISNIVKELSASGVLDTRASTRSGRRASYVTIAHAAGIVAGIHFSARHLRVVISDANRTVLSETHMPLARAHRADNELDRAALLLADMLAGMNSSVDKLLGIGIALPAPLRQPVGMVARNGILSGWSGVDVPHVMEDLLKRPVFVDNASNLAALAEARTGAGRGKDTLVFIDLDHGIGSGLILGGRLFRGHTGAAGELGHTVIREGGPVCRCGNRGCLEAIAGGPALIDQLEPEHGSMKLGDIVIRAVEGDPRTLRVLADAGRHIGLAVANLCNLLDPERVVIGGELARSGELILGPIRHAMERSVIVGPEAAPEVVQGQLGSHAAARGAVIHAIDNVSLQSNVS